MLTSEKPTSNTTLLDSTTFVVHTKKCVNIERGGNFDPGGPEFVEASN